MAKLPHTYDFTQNMLFRGGADALLNACVGENGGPYDLLDYGRGFFEGGSLIVAGARAMKAPVDIVVYPAAFAFRHGIELLLKHLVQRLLVFNEASVSYKRNHGIMDLFDLAAEQLAVARDVADPVEISLARDIIAAFNEIDPTGQVFRYPEDLKGNRHLTELKLINVEVLDDGMRVLREVLEGWIYHLDDMQDYKNERRRG